MIWKFCIVFFWGIGHFLSAIPGGVMTLGLPPWLSTLAAYAGYVAIAAVTLALGTKARDWVVQRFKLSLTPDPSKFFWRVWQRWGVAGLGLLAPFTCGPYIAAIIAVALGSKPRNVLFWIAIGCIPTALVLYVLTHSGAQASSLWRTGA